MEVRGAFEVDVWGILCGNIYIKLVLLTAAGAGAYQLCTQWRHDVKVGVSASALAWDLLKWV